MQAVQIFLALLSLAAVALAAPADADKLARRRRTMTNVGAPYVMEGTDLPVYMEWNTNYWTDLDLLMWDPQLNCLLSMKGANHPGPNLPHNGTQGWFCPLDGGDDNAGNGYYGRIGDYTSYVWGNINEINTIDGDATSSGSGSGVPGVEMILLSNPTPGDYYFFVYDWGSLQSNSYTYGLGPNLKKATNIELDIWTMNSHNIPVDSTFYYIDEGDVTNVTSCGGRFWHVCKITVTSNSPQVAFTVHPINVVSYTPYLSMGTTALQTFENSVSGRGSLSGCGL